MGEEDREVGGRDREKKSSSVASAPSDGAGQVARQGVRLMTELLARTDVGIEGPEPLDTG